MLTARSERKDAAANTARVIAAARAVVAAEGLGAGYHRIAAVAEVSAATVYRRFPRREDLLEAVLADVLGSLVGVAEAAEQQPDARLGFETVFRAIALENARNAGLSQTLEAHLSTATTALRRTLIDRFRAVVARAARSGCLRDGVTWEVGLLLTRVPGPEDTFMGVHGGDEIVDRACDALLAGLLVDRAPDPAS